MDLPRALPHAPVPGSGEAPGAFAVALRRHDQDPRVRIHRKKISGLRLLNACLGVLGEQGGVIHNLHPTTQRNAGAPDGAPALENHRRSLVSLLTILTLDRTPRLRTRRDRRASGAAV